MKTEIDQPKRVDALKKATAIELNDGKHILEEAVQISMLLRLTAELRNAIYEFAFIGTVVRVQTEKKDTTQDTAELPRYQSSVGLLFACRQLRWEATPFFQAHSIIDFEERLPRHVDQVIPPATCAAVQLIKIAPIDFEHYVVDFSRLYPNFRAGGLLQSVRKFTIRDSLKSFFPPRSAAEAEHWELPKGMNDQGTRKLEMELEYRAEDGEEPFRFSREVDLAFEPET